MNSLADLLAPGIADIVKDAVREVLLTEAPFIRQEPNGEPELLTIEQTCALFQISRQTERRWRDQGILQNAGVGGQIRYRRKDLNDLIQEKLHSRTDEVAK